MGSDSQSKWEKKIEELQTHIDNSTKMNDNNSDGNLVEQVKNWFSGLANPLKFGVSILAIIFALSLLNTVFWIARLLLSLTIFTAIVYFAYQFISRQNNTM